MEDLCPLCLKNGIKRNVKLLQINLQEAVWMCEYDKCPWPFGYKGFIFCPRVVGKIWSCYWDDHKSTVKLKENSLSSVKQLSLCDSSASLIKTVSTDLGGSTLNVSTNNLENSDVSTKQIKNDDCDLQTFLHNKSEIVSDSNEDRCESDAEGTNNSNKINSGSQLVNSETESKKISDECINASNKIFSEEKDSGMKNNENTNIIREIPKITSIKKTNIDILNIKGKQNLDKKLLCINKSTNMTGKTYLSNCSLESDKSINSELSTNYPYDNEVTEIKCNINTTKVEIGGLSPTTLSFEIPKCTTVFNKDVTVSNPEQSIDSSTIYSNVKLSTPVTRNAITKRKITSGKQYEKFSFCNIKKTLEVKSLNDSNNSNEKIINNTIRNETSNEISHSNKTIINCNSKNDKLTTSINNSCNITTNQTKQMNSIKADNSPNYKNSIQNTSSVTSSINIDTVLDDFLSNNCSIPKDVNDDWIDSLLI